MGSGLIGASVRWSPSREQEKRTTAASHTGSRPLRLYRPYIPLSVRVAVAERQLRELGLQVPALDASMRKHLSYHLAVLFWDRPCHLDHDPPLAARKRRGEGRNTVYTPDANDPNYLRYRDAEEHRIKTNVRGDGAQYPDRVLIKRARLAEHPKKTRPKKNWGRRPLRSANRWPPRGSRKLTCEKPRE